VHETVLCKKKISGRRTKKEFFFLFFLDDSFGKSFFESLSDHEERVLSLSHYMTTDETRVLASASVPV